MRNQTQCVTVMGAAAGSSVTPSGEMWYAGPIRFMAPYQEVRSRGFTAA